MSGKRKLTVIPLTFLASTKNCYDLRLVFMQVCEEFKLPVTGVVEGLAARAVRLSNSRPLEQSAAWQWLADNRPGNISSCG
jgi:hypothetical protein